MSPGRYIMETYLLEAGFSFPNAWCRGKKHNLPSAFLSLPVPHSLPQAEQQSLGSRPIATTHWWASQVISTPIPHLPPPHPGFPVSPRSPGKIIVTLGWGTEHKCTHISSSFKACSLPVPYPGLKTREQSLVHYSSIFLAHHTCPYHQFGQCRNRFFNGLVKEISTQRNMASVFFSTLTHHWAKGQRPTSSRFHISLQICMGSLISCWLG